MRGIKKTVSLLLAVVILAALFVAADADGAKTYLVLGDSIGYGLGVSNPDEANYGRIVANTNGYNYYNDAISGYRTDDLLRLINNDQNVISHVRAADIISVSIGGNDYLRDNMAQLIAEVEVGNTSTVDRIAVTMKANIAAIVERLRALNPDALILMQTLYNPMEGQALGSVYAVPIGVLNDFIRDYRDEHPGCYEIADVAGAFHGRSGLIAFDTIHPNAQGNIVIAQTVQKKLYDLGEAETDQILIVTEPVDHLSTKSFLTRLKELFEKIANFFKRLFGG